ncbi:MAG: FtsQ-type POTRA domain-containing protein [Bacillota bacterium]
MGRAGEKKRAVREGRGLTYGLIIFFCLFAGAFLFLRSPYFSVRDFEVDGAHEVSREEIVARSGQTATNIFAFDLDKASSLIETSPWIESASARRKLPGTIVLSVVERTPVAFMPVGDAIWLVDATGRVLDKDDGTWPDLVAMTGPSTLLTPGQFLDEETYGWGLRVLLALGSLSREKLIEISVQNGEAALILDDGCEVLIGKERNDPAARASLLESILEELAREGRIAERIDLRFDKPAVKDQFVKTPGR